MENFANHYVFSPAPRSDSLLPWMIDGELPHSSLKTPLEQVNQSNANSPGAKNVDKSGRFLFSMPQSSTPAITHGSTTSIKPTLSTRDIRYTMGQVTAEDEEVPQRSIQTSQAGERQMQGQSKEKESVNSSPIASESQTHIDEILPSKTLTSVDRFAAPSNPHNMSHVGINPTVQRTDQQASCSGSAKTENAPRSDNHSENALHGDPGHHANYSGKRRLPHSDSTVGKVPKISISLYRHETHVRPQSPVKPALELYTVCKNGHEDYSIERKTFKVPKWIELPILESTCHAGVTYKIKDTLYILLQDKQKNGVAKIRDIRDLLDGRNLILVSWYYSKDEARQWKCSNMIEWPTGCSHMLSTHLQVLMWDTANGKVTGEHLEQVVDKKIIHFRGKTAKIYDKSETEVRWLSTSIGKKTQWIWDSTSSADICT
jgi:hypothetical protein